jgi:hypothetical protein
VAVTLYMDQHVPGPITSGLRLVGVDVLTAFEDGSHELPDEDLLERSTYLKRVLFTQDDDLLAIAHRHQENDHPFAGVIYGHQLRLSIGRAIEDLTLLATCCEPAEFRNAVQFIPL